MFATGSGNNNTGFSSAEYDRLLEKALAAETAPARMEVYQQLDAILAREVPVMPVYFYTRVYALAPQVTGWPPNILDNHAWKNVDLLSGPPRQISR